VSRESTDDAGREVLDVFDSLGPPGEPLTTSEVAEALGCTRRSAYDRLERLAELGALRTKKAGARARVWWRARETDTDEDGPNLTLAEYESLLSDVVDNAEVGVFVLDDAFQVAWTNETMKRYFGLTGTPVVGRDKRELIETTVSENVVEPASFSEQVLDTYDDNTYTETIECRVRTGADGDRWLEHRSRPIERGQFAGGRVEIYFDVTERKAAESALREEREQFQSLVDAVREYAIFMLDTDGRVVTWNDGAAEIKGYDREEIVGEHFSTFYTDDDVADGMPEANLESARLNGSTVTEGWRVRRDGSRFWARVTITAIRDEDGTHRGYAKVTRDMTEQRSFEEDIRTERNLLEQILDTSPIGIAVLDEHGSLVRANERVESMLEPADWDSPGTALERILGEERGGDVPLVEDEAVETGTDGVQTVTNREVRLTAEDGADRWVSVNATRLDGDSGRGQTVVTLSDVTRLKEQARRLERRREEVESELNEVFERIDDAFFALDDEWQFSYVNEQAAGILGRSRGELVGESVWEAFPEAAGSRFQTQYERARERQESVSFEEYYPPLERWFEVNAYPSESGLSVYFRDVTERKERERELEHQREQLTALNNLNAVVREITEAVVAQSTREEIEQVVCNRLAAADSYEFAWIAGIDPVTQALTPRVEAGVDGYLSDVVVTADADESTGRGPAGRAVQTHEIQVSQNVFEDPDFEPWREEARRYGYRSSAGIPILHEGTLYGILGVYTARPDAFEGEELDVIDQLGEIVGHAIASIERKRALMSDDVVEISFRIDDVFDTGSVPPGTVGTITLEQTVPVGGEEYLVYGTMPGDDEPVLEALVDQFPSWESVTYHGSDRFELRLSEPPVLSAVASVGGNIKNVALEDGDLRMTIHLPPSVEVRSIIDVVTGEYPGAELLTRRQVTREANTPGDLQDALANELTDRQRSALEAAYYAGFFEWPRASSGEDVAESLGISSPTFHQHLRKGQLKLMEAAFGTRDSVRE
jgi:PAS domain S-box-containing protein